MLPTLLFLLSAAYGREVDHYFARCGTDDIKFIGVKPTMDDNSAEVIGEELCDSDLGLRELIIAKGERRMRAQLLYDIQKEIDEQLRKNYKRETRKEHETQLEDFAPVDVTEEDQFNCPEKRTEYVNAWICPQGTVVLDKNLCGGQYVSAGDYAFAVEWGPFLPKGAICNGVIAESREAILARYAVRTLQDPLYKKRYTEAWLAWKRAEAEAAPYDCLAGVCLNSNNANTLDRIVRVAGQNMHLRVATCADRVTIVQVSRGWTLESFDWSDILPTAKRRTYSDGSDAYYFFLLIGKEHEALGWRTRDSFLIHPERKGERFINFETASSGMGWRVDIYTRHPNRDTLCSANRQQGL